MSKNNQPVTFEYYQEKGYKLFDKFRELEEAVTLRSRLLIPIEINIKITQELEQWEKQVQSTLGKKVSPTAKAKKTCELQDHHYQKLTPGERLMAILKNDYDIQKFNGRGKTLLADEIEKLAPAIKILSFSKENRKNKALLKTMESIVEKLEELEKIQKELRGSKKVTQVKDKEKTALPQKKKIESSSTEQEPKQKPPKNDMFSQREQQFKKGRPLVNLHQEEETTIKMEEMDGLEESQRVAIAV